MELLLHWQHFFFYGTINSKNNVTKVAHISQIEWTEPAAKSIDSVMTITEEEDFEQNEAAVNNAEQVVLEQGSSLRILAQEKLGNKEFWVYIYLKNQQKIKNPNVVPYGIELTLPHNSEYDMNSTDVAAVEKAKQMGDKILKDFK